MASDPKPISTLFGAPVALLVIGCLFIALSDGPASWPAVAGFICLALALIGAILGFAKRRNMRSD